MRTRLIQLKPTMEEFGAWLKGARPGHGQILATMLHHTYIPNADDYRGHSTIRGIQDYHIHTRGWSDIGANAYACPDGTVFTARPVTAKNFAHAVVSRRWVSGSYIDELTAGDRQWFNKYAFGLEMVANFNSEDPDGHPSFECALQALTIVHRVYDIPPDHLFFHRNVANKTCPGSKLDHASVREQLAQRLANDNSTFTLKVVTWPYTVLGSIQMPAGHWRVVPNGDHIADQRKIYVERVGENDAGAHF